MAHNLESDEAFARRLQAQELGLLRATNNTTDAQIPLMVKSRLLFIRSSIPKRSLPSKYREIAVQTEEMQIPMEMATPTSLMHE